MNDSEATANAIADFGCVGLIIASGPVVYDNESQEFKKWHGKQKLEKSSYEEKNEERKAKSRKRKTSMTISKISFTSNLAFFLILLKEFLGIRFLSLIISATANSTFFQVSNLF